MNNREKQTQKEYQHLHDISRKARTLSGVSSLLEWDQETYMPSGGALIRAEQLKTLAGIIHKEKTSKKFSNALSKLVDIKTGKMTQEISQRQQAALREWRRDYLIETALPTHFVESFAQLTSQAILVWQNARKENSFSQFAPFLEKIITMCRKKADLIGFEEHPYDALTDLYEQGFSTKEISALFKELRRSICTLLKKIVSAKQVDDSFLIGQFPLDKQISFSNKLLEAMGFDKKNGRLDFSTHPFSSACHPNDSRITTRIDPNNVMNNIGIILHEAGHSLYEMGLPIDHYGSPLGEAIGLGMHESQSRWWETRIGQSKSFWHHWLPLLKQEFKKTFDSVSLDTFYKGINKVTPSLIRVDADEVTYSLHVILRFEMERDLIDGTLPVKDIPDAWNAKMKELLGVAPNTDSEGCLQDIHWSMGAFGYFPSYTLGNLYAAHLFKGFEKTHPDWTDKVSQGELLFVKEWLNSHVHQHGRQYNSKGLLKKVTGHSFSADSYIHYLNDKYSEIYSLNI